MPYKRAKVKKKYIPISGKLLDKVREVPRCRPLLFSNGRELCELDYQTRDYFFCLERWLTLAVRTPGTARVIYGGKDGQTKQGMVVIPWR